MEKNWRDSLENLTEAVETAEKVNCSIEHHDWKLTPTYNHPYTYKCKACGAVRSINRAQRRASQRAAKKKAS